MKIIYTLTLVMVICAFSHSDRSIYHPFVDGPLEETVLTAIQSDLGPVIMVSDSSELPLFYYQEIFTGVCLDKQCKPVDIVLYWDPSGSFLGFYSPKNEHLTKKDHIVFTNYEYYILYTILNNPYSVLGKKKFDELTSKNSMQEVDGVSGSTTIVDKNAVVQGAAYTCYTLWHLANDTSLTIALRRQTQQLLNKKGVLTGHTSNTSAHCKKHPAELAMELYNANANKKIKKHKVQLQFTEGISEASALNAIIVNNYISRQVFIFPEIEAILANDVKTDALFNRMIGN